MYQGIALFGDPGIGKSTVARYLHALLPESSYREGADVLYRIAALERIPSSKELLIKAALAQKAMKKPDRAESKKLFQQLATMDGADVIASILIAEHGENTVPLIISGARGIVNAKFFQTSG
ncbi:MAG: ATP-binding protein, partial [Candidatus Uhrbacteria bacterium]|nr:ATP-binding protein [Candidatus Uhrbacteria bacterium]